MLRGNVNPNDLLDFIRNLQENLQRTRPSNYDRLEELKDRYAQLLVMAYALIGLDPLLPETDEDEPYDDELKDWLSDRVGRLELRVSQVAAAAKRWTAFVTDRRTSVSSSSSEVTSNKRQEQSPNSVERVFPAGTPLDAYKTLRDLIRSAQKSIFLVDNYIDGDIVELLQAATNSAEIKILTRQIQGDFRAQAKRFQQQRSRNPQVGMLEVRISDQIHDRYLILDGSKMLHVGASIKDAGQRMSSLVEHGDPNVRSAVVRALDEYWNKGQKIEL